MPGCALLIDWENIKSSLDAQRYWLPIDEIAKGLRLKAEAYADANGVSLNHKAVFSPAATLAGDLITALQQGLGQDLTLRPTMAGKNAADMELVMEVQDLRHVEGYTHFIIVSGDVDYLPMAVKLEAAHCACQLWAGDPVHVRREVREYGAKFVPELLGLNKMSPPALDAMDLFLLLAQRAIGEGTALWSYPKSIEALSGYGVLTREEVEQRWSDAENKGWFQQDPGPPGQARRLKYSHPRQLLVLRAVDRMLERLHRDERNRQATDRQALNGAIDHLIEDPTEREQIIDAVVQAGSYLDEVNDRYSLSRPIRRHGVLRPLSLIPLIIVTQCFRKDHGWTGANKALINVGWQRVYKTFGEVDAADKQRSDAEAKEILDAAVAANVVVRVRGTYEPNKNHPVVADMGDRVRALVCAIAADGGQIAETELRARLAAWDPSEVDFWLSALAGQRQIRWIHREDKVQLRNNSKLVQWLTALCKN